MPARGGGKVGIAMGFINRHPGATKADLEKYFSQENLGLCNSNLFYKARSMLKAAEKHSSNGKPRPRWSEGARAAATEARGGQVKRASVTELAYCPCCGLDLKVIKAALRLAKKMKGSEEEAES